MEICIGHQKKRKLQSQAEQTSSNVASRKERERLALACTLIRSVLLFNVKDAAHVAFVLDEREIRWDGLIPFYVITIRE